MVWITCAITWLFPTFHSTILVKLKVDWLIEGQNDRFRKFNILRNFTLKIKKRDFISPLDIISNWNYIDEFKFDVLNLMFLTFFFWPFSAEFDSNLNTLFVQWMYKLPFLAFPSRRQTYFYFKSYMKKGCYLCAY